MFSEIEMVNSFRLSRGFAAGGSVVFGTAFTFAGGDGDFLTTGFAAAALGGVEEGGFPEAGGGKILSVIDDAKSCKLLNGFDAGCVDFCAAVFGGEVVALGIVTFVTFKGFGWRGDEVVTGGAFGGFGVVMSTSRDAGVEGGVEGGTTGIFGVGANDSVGVLLVRNLKSSTPVPVMGLSKSFLRRPNERGRGRVVIPGLASPLAYFKPSGPPKPPALPIDGSMTARLVMRVQKPSSSKVNDMACGGPVKPGAVGLTSTQMRTGS